MKTTQAVIGKWDRVFQEFDLPPITRSRHFKGESPCCNRKNKFRIDDKQGRGTFICACGASGDGWDLLRIKTGKKFRELADQVDKIIGNTPTYEYEPKKVNNEYKYRIKNSLPLKGSNVEKYLNSRGIFTLPEKGLFASKGNMYAVAINEYFEPAYSHETFLDGDKKEDIEENKITKTIKKSEMAAIRLFDMSETLGIAEGIETALSCKQIYKCNTWSVISSTFMKKFRAPKGVENLFIFADNDSNGTGLAAAFECGNRNILCNNDVKSVRIRWCKSVVDFNDFLFAPSEVLEWCLK